LVDVTAVFTITLWLPLDRRDSGRVLADRWTQNAPDDLDPMVLDLQSVCWFGAVIRLLFLARALLGIAWVPNGRRCALAMGDVAIVCFMPGCCKPHGVSGVRCPSAAYALLYDSIGWRGLLIMGVLPAWWWCISAAT